MGQQGSYHYIPGMPYHKSFFTASMNAFMWNISLSFIVWYATEHKSTQLIVVVCCRAVCSPNLRSTSSKLRVDSPPRLPLTPNCHAVPEKQSGRKNQNTHWEHFHNFCGGFVRMTQLFCEERWWGKLKGPAQRLSSALLFLSNWCGCAAPSDIVLNQSLL